MKSNKRILLWDTVRSICFFWIIGIWHLQNYISGLSPILSGEMATQFTYGILACFTMLSGMFAGNKQFLNLSDVLDYYKKRFLRIYPLYSIAILMFRMVGLIDYSDELISALLLISMFNGKTPITLWYINMILLYYLLTPLIIIISRKSYKFICVLALWALFAVLADYLSVDTRLAFYWPFYMVPLVFDSMRNVLNCQIRINSKWMSTAVNISILLLAALVIWFMFSLDIGTGFSLFSYIICLCTVILVISSAQIIDSMGYVFKGRILIKISYASMCGYLFHRVIYSVFLRITCLDRGGTLLTGYLIMVPLCMLVSYFIQYAYDIVVKRSGCT